MAPTAAALLRRVRSSTAPQTSNAASARREVVPPRALRLAKNKILNVRAKQPCKVCCMPSDGRSGEAECDHKVHATINTFYNSERVHYIPKRTFKWSKLVHACVYLVREIPDEDRSGSSAEWLSSTSVSRPSYAHSISVKCSPASTDPNFSELSIGMPIQLSGQGRDCWE